MLLLRDTGLVEEGGGARKSPQKPRGEEDWGDHRHREFKLLKRINLGRKLELFGHSFVHCAGDLKLHCHPYCPCHWHLDPVHYSSLSSCCLALRGFAWVGDHLAISSYVPLGQVIFREFFWGQGCNFLFVLTGIRNPVASAAWRAVVGVYIFKL